MTSILTEGDLVRGRAPDVAAHGWQRRAGSRELTPEFCRSGHRPDRYRAGWEPGLGRTYECTVPGCTSVQYRR